MSWRRAAILVSGVALAASLAAALTQGASPPSTPAIAEVQGRGHASPFDGKRVALRGIVTAVDTQARRPGFWMQSAEEDGDPATAEGLRVDTTGVPALAPGDLVAIEGEVAEGQGRPGELKVTRLTGASWETIERGRRLPAAIRIVSAAAAAVGANVSARESSRGGGGSDRGVAPPASGVDDDGLSRFEPGEDAIDFFESLEGMRVEIERPIVVGPTSNYRDFVVLAGEGAGGSARSWRGGLVARPGDDDPERILIDPRLVGEVPRVGVGDVYQGSLRGIVDYAFGSYRVMLTEPPPALERRSGPRDRTTLRGDDRHLLIATWNVFDLGGDDGDGVFRSIARSLVQDLGAPDLVALEEIADASGRRDDGVVEGAPTLVRLVAAIRAAGGPVYEFRQIDPRNNRDGGAPGSNIRVALLFDPARVALAERGNGDAVTPTAVLSGPSLSLSPGRVEPLDAAWHNSRKPLAAELSFADRPIFVVANHFASKLEDDPQFGDTQPPVRWSERRRREQAAVVAGVVRDLLDADRSAAVVVLGDLNEHWFGEPLEPLVAAGLEPLINRVPLEERYTYNYRGSSQVLDHVLVSSALAAGAEVDVVHTNADFPAWGRSSDHDAVVVRLRIR